MKELEEYVRSIPDFPEPGAIFRDVTSILQNTDRPHMAVDSLIDMVRDLDYDLVIDSESRGSIFGMPVAYAQHKGFMPVRKEGELPCETITMGYDPEYGQVTIEIHKDVIRPDQEVIIVGDPITTRGTTKATMELIKRLGEQAVRVCFVMELAGLNGREHLRGYDVDSAIVYKGG